MIFHLCKETISHKTEGFPMAYYAVDARHPRYVMMHHWHPETELICVEQGKLTLTTDGNVTELEEGRYAWVPAGTVHSGTPENCRYRCVVFDGQMALNLLQGKTKSKGEQVLKTFFCGEITPQIETLFRALILHREGYQADALSALFGFLGERIRTLPVQNAPQAPLRSRLIPFEQAVLYIREHFQEPVSLQELSRAAGLSEKYFGEYFKNVTGVPPVRYLNEYRLERAAELLHHKDRTVTEIAFECGFNDLSYFIKSFRKQYGFSPSAYRSQSEK